MSAAQQARALSSVNEAGVWQWGGTDAQLAALCWELEHGEDARRGAGPCPKRRNRRHWWAYDSAIDGQRCTACQGIE